MESESPQLKFLQEAASKGIDSALEKYPGVLSEEEERSLRNLSNNQLTSLLEIRKSIESNESKGIITGKDGNGILSF